MYARSNDSMSLKTAASCAAILLAVLLALPATVRAEEAKDAPAVSSEEALRQRATEYWEARIKRSPDSIQFYGKTDSGAEAVDFPEFGSLQYDDYKIEEIEVTGNEGLVHITVAPPKLMLGSKPLAELEERRPRIQERWVRQDGTWFKRPVDRSLSRLFKGRRETTREAARAKRREAREKSAE